MKIWTKSALSQAAEYIGCRSPVRRRLVWSLAIAALAQFTAGCCRPLVYKPVYEPTRVHSPDVSRPIITLAGFPRNATHVERGINTHTGQPQPEQIVEMFDWNVGEAEYRFTLFAFESAAARYLEAEKKHSRVPPFRQESSHGTTLVLFHDRQPRADPEGGCAPLGYYVSKAAVRIRNLVVDVRVDHRQQQSDALARAIEHLDDTLAAALGESGSVP